MTASPGSRFARNRPKALELFARRGFAQVSLRELARHLELTAGSLYSHCASKEELLLEFIEEHYLALLSLFDQRRLRGCPKAALQRVVEGLVALYESNPLHFQLATRDAGCLNDEQRQCVERLRRQLGQKLDAQLGAAGYASPGQACQPTLELFEHLPLWLARYPLDRQQRCAALLRSLTAALAPGASPIRSE
ncbi:TetR/AcrR family transcriptional regulator [Pseudomonas citronellolis]|jgi:AcrR family transcriptional regulator|uniref:TetR/AcrR family transcriptional regulator n=1 Tax=Pseudomonas citronellolis TaxID=53408 RepID=UPI002271E451|nr:TetR/AcrR family transcriptional regulator [Pseudomonas citronellolis]WAB90531.1 helix-turn-helix domain containing protein [Pseudomonas citronellolis]